MATSFTSLKSIFIEAQDSKNQHQLILGFCRLYSMEPFEDFSTELLKLIKHPVSVFQREQAVERTIEFIAKAVAHLAIKESSKGQKLSNAEEHTETEHFSDDDFEEEMHPLLLKLFEFLLEVHSAKSRGVRFRVCQLISRLLQNLGEGAQIDDSLYDTIYKCMLERMRDKCPTVRVHAVLALSRLQNPSDESCPVTKAYKILVTRDPNVEVRRIVLTNLVPSAGSLPVILERTRDVKDTVRITAFSVIAEKVPFRALKIEQRIQLLQDGLNDRSEVVRTAFSNKVLQTWLNTCEGNVLEFLNRLDVQSCVKTCEKALTTMMNSCSGILDLIQKFDIINDKVLIDAEKLTCESSFYWSRLIQFVYNAGHMYDEQLDLIRPNCVQLCTYIEDFTKKLGACQDEDEMMDLEFIMEQLLLILSFMDVSDQTSRKTMQSLLHNLIMWDSVWPSLMIHIMPCLKLIHQDINKLTSFLAETISEIREPITTVEKALSKGEQRDLDKKIAGIKLKIHELREELSICIQNEDYEKAAELKASISNLDGEKTELMAGEKACVEEVRIQKNDPLTLLKCLTLLCEFLSMPKVKTISPTLQTLMENEILPGMTSEVSEIRNFALKAIGLCCLINKEIIFQHLPLLLQASQIDTQLVRITALKSIFDLIHTHGLEAFNNISRISNQESTNDIDELEKSSSNETSDEQKRSTADVSSVSVDEGCPGVGDNQGMNEAANKIINILIAALDNESLEIRIVAVEGFSKLLLSNRLISSALLSRLLLLWFNPLSEEDPALLQILGIFFPLFAFANSSNQELVEEAFLPTLRTILRAPSSSPLAEVNKLNVANFLCGLTDSEYLIENQKQPSSVKENTCHDSLAVKLCNEVLSSPDSINVKFYLKVLGQLFITSYNVFLLRDLVTLCEKMFTVVTEKQCAKQINDFMENISEMLSNVTKDQGGPDQSGTERTTNETQKELGDPTGELDEQPTLNEAKTPADTTKTLDITAKTPANQKSMHASKAKSTLRSTRQATKSRLEDSTFSTPALRKARCAQALEESQMNLENLLLETSVSKTPGNKSSGKTPKRPLHNIQDPSFV